MNDQLVLLDDDEARRERWRLDEHTREIGRRGVALARQALRHASPADSTPGRPASAGAASRAA